MSGTHLTEAEDGQVGRLYAQGYSQAQITTKIGRSRSAVARSMERQSMPRRTAREGLISRNTRERIGRIASRASVFHLFSQPNQ